MRLRHCGGDDITHLQESASSFTESEVNDLVCRIEHTRHISSPTHGFVGKSQVRETMQVRLFEGQILEREQVRTREITLEPFREGEGVLDRQAHVRRTELCFDGAIGELHSRMDDGLRMHEYLYLLHGHAEEPFGFDDFEAFIHHRCGVDGDLSSHIPVRMLECIGGCDGTHLIERESTEGSAAGREKDFLYLAAIFTDERLEDCTMLAIDRQDRRMVLLREFADDLTGHNEGFLVGQRDRLTGFYGFDGRAQTCVSDHGCHNDVDGRHSDHLGNRVRACPNFAV